MLYIIRQVTRVIFCFSLLFFLWGRGGTSTARDGTQAARMSHRTRTSPIRAYDFLLKFLLVGDSDVGKGEILESLQDGASESPYGYNLGE